MDFKITIQENMLITDLFKATAVKYGFDNPIGEDTGEERRYLEDYEEED